MEILAVLALIVTCLFLAAPFIAFSALNKAKQALKDVAALQAELARFRLEYGQSLPAPIRGDTLAGPTSPDANFADEKPLEEPRDPAERAGPAPVETAEPAPVEPVESTQREPDVFEAAEQPAAPNDIPAPTEPTPPEAPVIHEAARDELPSPPRARDFEESIGSRWAVWVGGVALAFGGLFLVRYSIEMGIFGPGVRLLMGAAFAIACGVGSEYVRRADLKLSLGALPPTQIPSILAGVSVLSAFAVVYAAHGIYGFIGPTPAFVLMGLIGVGALAVSIVHGPLFGLFGVAGSYATPLLVSSTAPAFGSLSFFIAAVTCVAFLLHSRRTHTVVTLSAIAGHSVWTWLVAAYEPADKVWSTFLMVAAAVLAVLLLKELPARRARDSGFAISPTMGWFERRFDMVGFTAIAAPLILSGVCWAAFGGPVATHVAIIVTVAAATVAAARYRDLAPLAPLAGAAATGMILLWPTGSGPIGVTPTLLLDLVRLSLGVDTASGVVATAALFAALAGGALFHALRTRKGAGDGDAVSRACLAFASALTPVTIMLATALRVNGFNRSTAFALIGFVLTGVLFWASETLYSVEMRRSRARANPLAFVGSAAYAASAAIALGLAIAFSLRETWLVVGLAIAATGVAMVASVRPIPLLRSMSAALATAAFGRFIWQPFLTDVGSWPILNWLIVAYAVPALCFAAGSLLLSAQRDRPRNIHEALAAFFGAAFLMLEIHQLFAGPNISPTWQLLAGHWMEPRNRLFEEAAMQAVAIGGVGAALFWASRRVASRVLLAGSDIAAMAVILVAVAGLGGVLNPLFDGTLVVGLPVFNRLLLYPLAGVALGAMGFVLIRRYGRSRLGDALSGVAALLVALGAILIVRRVFAGPLLVATDDGFGFGESVCVTIVLLALASATRVWFEAGGGGVVRAIMNLTAGAAVAWAALSLLAGNNPLFDGGAVDGPIIFNRILWGYGAIAIGFAAASVWMREQAPRIGSYFKGASAVFAVVGAFLLMRHGFHGPLLFSDEQVTLAEGGWYAMIAFTVSIIVSVKGFVAAAGAYARVRPEGPAIASVAVFAMFPGFVANPILTGAPLAGVMIFDNALVGYLIPAALAFVAARWAREHAPGDVARRTYGAAAIAGCLAYLMIEVRRWFVGPDLWAVGQNESELYAYSAVVLGYGVALLALGFRIKSKDLRLAAMAVITLAVCKVFLVDMAGLKGLLRALSFIGLGGSLVAIGLAYQRMLQREALKSSESETR